jgi:polyisoprenoid-binding protein YceI
MANNLKFLMALSIFFLASAGARDYVILPHHSGLRFEVEYMGVTKVAGSFGELKGAFKRSEKGEVSDVRVEVEVSSLSTQEAKRDQHLMREDFFWQSKFNQMSFVSKKISYAAGKVMSVTGELSLRGVTRTETFSIADKGEVKDPFDSKKSSWFYELKGKINRKDYGLTWNKALELGGWLVGDEVDISGVIEAAPSDNRPAFSRFFVPPESNRAAPEILEQEIVGAVEKKQDVSNLQTEANPTNENESALWVSVKMLGGFALFLGITLFGYLIEKFLLIKLSTRFTPFWSEAVSDAILYTFIFCGMVWSAPMMGY